MAAWLCICQVMLAAMKCQCRFRWKWSLMTVIVVAFQAVNWRINVDRRIFALIDGDIDVNTSCARYSGNCVAVIDHRRISVNDKDKH